jgi:hypothetical protein
MILKRTSLVAAIILYGTLIFSMSGSIPTGLPGTFGFGAIDKADSYAASQPQFWKDGQYTPCSGWDYSYQYLTPGWSSWISGGGWAKQELQYWEGKGQIQVFTFYYTPYTLSNYTQASWMNTYFNDFKTLMQVINANSSKVVIVHIEPDFLGYMRQKGTGAYNQSGLVMVKSSGFNETDDGVAISSLPDTLQGWSEALFRIRNQYAKNKVILAHHFTHWATGTDLFVDTQDQTTCNTNIDDMCTFIKNVENGHPYDLFFVDPADRDADWYRIKGGGSNTRWTGPTRTFTTDRNWGKLSYITDRISTNLTRRGMFWQIPAGNTYYKTCNNTDNHYRDNSAQEFLPSTTTDGSSGTPGDAYSASDTTKGPGYWAQYGIIGVLFGEGGFDTNANPNNMTHLRDWPSDGITNPGSDSGTGGPSYDVWGKATSSVSDNEGGYIRAAVNKYCQVGKYVIGGAQPTKTNTPVAPTSTFTLTFTKTNTPVVPTATFTSTATRTNTPVPPTSTPTPTFTATPSVTRTVTPTFTLTSTPLVPSATFTSTAAAFTPTFTQTPSATRTNTAVVPSATFTTTSIALPSATFTATAANPTATASPTRTLTAIIFSPTQTNTAQPTNTFTAVVPTNTRTTGATPTQTQLMPSATATATATFTSTQPTATITVTPTEIPTNSTQTPTASQTQVVLQPTPTMTRTSSATAVSSPTFTYTVTSAITLTQQQTPTFTATATVSLTQGINPVVYPNPSSNGQITIRFNASGSANNLKILIYTKAFRLVRDININSNFKQGINEVNLGVQYMMEFSKGTYLFKLILKDNNGRTESSRLGSFIIL